MHITVEPRDDYAVLHLRGDFDTYYCPRFQAEVEALVQSGIFRAILDLRLIQFVNSTALGAMIQATKELASHGGRLVIARPSAFSRDIIDRVGLDRVIPVFESEEEAVEHVRSSRPEPSGGDDPFREDESSVIFAPADPDRIEHFLGTDPLGGGRPDGGRPEGRKGRRLGRRWRGIGRMAGVDEKGLRFTWRGGTTDLTPFAMAQMLAIGTDWNVRFRLPLLQRGTCQASAVVAEVEEREDGVKIGANFTSIDEPTRLAIRQYARDMAFLREELRRATQ